MPTDASPQADLPPSDLGKLAQVCVKMLFRPSTRTRFACLLGAFLFTLVFNTATFVTRLHRTETQRRGLLAETAFQVFFMRMRSPGDLGRFVRRQGGELAEMGAATVPGAFIYQNHLYLDVPGPGAVDPALGRVYDLFGVRRSLETLRSSGLHPAHLAAWCNGYIDYNGRELDAGLRQGRRHQLQRDLLDIGDALRGSLAGRRLAVFNEVRRRLIRDLAPLPNPSSAGPQPFVSRVELVVPMLLGHLFFNMARDNTTDVFDLATLIAKRPDGRLEVPRAYLEPPPPFAGASLYGEQDIYPRYVPLDAPGLLRSGWHWLLYRDLVLDHRLLDRIEALHARGHYLFSYEKIHTLRQRAAQIRRDLFWNQLQFYLTDLTLGVAFPFMMSLFAFVHLKAELAFMLMFRNLIRQVLAIFWLLPLALMLLVKGGVLAVFLGLSASAGDMWTALLLPPTAAYALAALVFYPINRWCFAQLTGRRLNLYALHRG